MNTKLKKTLKITAAGIFVIALAINVSVTLSDPFSTVSNVVLAQTTGGSSNTGSGTGLGNGDGWFDTPQEVECPRSEWAVNVTTPSSSTSYGYNGAGSVSVSYGGATVSASYNGGSASYSYNSGSGTQPLVKTYKRTCIDVFNVTGCSPLGCRILQ